MELEPKLKWTDILDQVRDTSGSAILVGNGASISFQCNFAYKDLWDFVKLPERVRTLQMKFNPASLERLMGYLENALTVAAEYGCGALLDNDNPISKDITVLKDRFVEAISGVHGIASDASCLPTKEPPLLAVQLFEIFKSVYTTNYDLLLYWAFQRWLEGQSETNKKGDGFRRSGGSLVFDRLPSEGGLRHLHGGLHLMPEGVGATKLAYKPQKPILEQVCEHINNRNQYPLIVAAGTKQTKVQEIQSSRYLSECLREFSELPRLLVVFGSRLDRMDEHIVDAIKANKRLEQLFLGWHSDDDRAHLHQIAKDLKLACNELSVHLYCTQGVNLWEQ